MSEPQWCKSHKFHVCILTIENDGHQDQVKKQKISFIWSENLSSFNTLPFSSRFFTSQPKSQNSYNLLPTLPRTWKTSANRRAFRHIFWKAGVKLNWITNRRKIQIKFPKLRLATQHLLQTTHLSNFSTTKLSLLIPSTLPDMKKSAADTATCVTTSRCM